MKYYNPPQLTMLGSLSQLTAVDQSVSEADVFITATGEETTGEGPASQIVCVDNNDDGICDADQMKF